MTTFGSIIWFLNPEIQTSRNPGIPLIWYGLVSRFKCIGCYYCSLFAKQFDFQYKISLSVIFQELPGTLKLPWNQPFFGQIWHIGYQFHLIFVTELEFGLNNWKMSCFGIFSGNFWILIPGFQKWPGIGHFSIIKAKFKFSDKN